MPKPSQYFIDKSEAINISNTLKEHLNDQDVLVKQVRSQSFVSKYLYSLAATSQVDNPYESATVAYECKQQLSRYKTNYVYYKPDNIPAEVLKAEYYISKHSKAFAITENFAKDLAKLGGPQDPPQIQLGEVQIAHKREAMLFNDKIELKPTVFELPKIQNFNYSKDPDAFIEDKEIEQLNEVQEKYKRFSPTFRLDNRVPLRVIQVEQFQEQVKKAYGSPETVRDAQVDSKSQTQAVHVKASQKYLDHSDFAVNSTFLRKTSERMLGTVYYISNHKYFIEGKCRCHCHTQSSDGKRICNICLCKLYNDDDMYTGSNQNFYSNNLLKNTNLPLYVIKNQEKNILMTDGRLTRGQVLDLIHQELDEMGPDERILHVAKQQYLLADKVWSPKLRSDIAPKIKAADLENLITQAHIEAQESQLVHADQFTSAGKVQMDKRHAAQASELVVSYTAHLDVEMYRKKVQSAEEELRRKLSRYINEQRILEMRKAHKSGVDKIIEQSILNAEKEPQSKYHHYYPPSPKEPLLNTYQTLQARSQVDIYVYKSQAKAVARVDTKDSLQLDENDLRFFDCYENQQSDANTNVTSVCGNISANQQSADYNEASKSRSGFCSSMQNSAEVTDESGAGNTSFSRTYMSSDFQSSSAFPTTHSTSSTVAAPQAMRKKTVLRNNQDLPPYLPSNRAASPDAKMNVPPKYLQPRTVDRIGRTRHDYEIDYKRVHAHEKLNDLIADPTLPYMTQKQYQRIINKAYDRLEDLNEYVELKMIYCREPINFNDFTQLRKKHVKSSLK